MDGKDHQLTAGQNSTVTLEGDSTMERFRATCCYGGGATDNPPPSPTPYAAPRSQ